MKIDKNKKAKKGKKNAKAVPKAKVLIVAQELKFARLLAGNEKKSRDRVLKSLKKWLNNCFEKEYDFKEEDFIRVWKGLFYAVWMSDKPLIQEELCESISALLDQFPLGQYKHALLMYKAGLRVLATEWYGLDQHRIDKFLMLVRRLLRASLRCVARQEWSEEACKQYSDALTDDSILSVTTPAFARNALSLMLHICDCFLEELSKVSKGELPTESVAALLEPFVAYVCGGQELRGCIAARRVFTQLLRQSAVGVEYEERRRAWERMGCPEGGPDALEAISDDDNEDGDENGDQSAGDDSENVGENGDDGGELDPRAGRGDVVLRSLPVPAAELARRLRVRLRVARGQHHTRAKRCLLRFEQFASSQYPLRVSPAPAALPEQLPPARAAARRLARLDRKLRHDPGRAAMRGLSRKHRKRLLAKSREGLSIVEELAALQPKTSAQTNGNWKVEDAQPLKTASEDSSNKENFNKNAKKPKKRKPSDETDDDSPSKKQKLDDNKPKVQHNGKDKKSKEKTKDSSPKTAKSDSDTSNKKLRKLKITITESAVKGKPDKAKVREQLAAQKVNTQNTTVVANKARNFQKQTTPAKIEKKSGKKAIQAEDKTPKAKSSFDTPKKIKFALKNNSMQSTLDYYKSVRQSPNIPFDSKKQPTKTNLKPNSTPSPINPFFKKKLRMKS